MENDEPFSSKLQALQASCTAICLVYTLNRTHSQSLYSKVSNFMALVNDVDKPVKKSKVAVAFQRLIIDDLGEMRSLQEYITKGVGESGDPVSIVFGFGVMKNLNHEICIPATLIARRAKAISEEARRKYKDDCITKPEYACRLTFMLSLAEVCFESLRYEPELFRKHSEVLARKIEMTREMITKSTQPKRGAGMFGVLPGLFSGFGDIASRVMSVAGEFGVGNEAELLKKNANSLSIDTVQEAKDSTMPYIQKYQNLITPENAMLIADMAKKIQKDPEIMRKASLVAAKTLVTLTDEISKKEITDTFQTVAQEAMEATRKITSSLDKDDKANLNTYTVNDLMSKLIFATNELNVAAKERIEQESRLAIELPPGYVNPNCLEA